MTTLLTGVLALVLLVVPTTVDKVTLTASTYLCSGYSGCQAAGYGHAGYRQAASYHIDRLRDALKKYNRLR